VLKNQRNGQKDFGTPGEFFAKTRGGNALFPYFLIYTASGIGLVLIFHTSSNFTRFD